MRPVNQPPLSLMAMKRSPLASSRRPDKPPKPRNREVSTNPLRNSSSPKRTRERSRVSKPASGRALTSIETGAVTQYSSGLYFGGRCTAVCATADFGSASANSPAVVDVRKARRPSCPPLMVRRRSCAVSDDAPRRRENHEAAEPPHLSRRGASAAPQDEVNRVRGGSSHRRSEERRVGKECRSRWSAAH